MNKLYIFLFLFLGLASCGSDDPVTEMEEPDCDGAITISVDGETKEFDEPFSATFVFLEASNLHELLVVWMKGSTSVSFQVAIDEDVMDCFPTGRINLRELPAGISILGFQYVEFSGIQISVSNVFIEDGGDGWIDIKACDGANDKVSVDFEFDGVTTTGDLVQVRGGSASDICFKRTK